MMVSDGLNSPKATGAQPAAEWGTGRRRGLASARRRGPRDREGRVWQRRKRQQGMAKQVTELQTEQWRGQWGGGWKDQGLQGHRGEGFLSDSLVDVAPLSQAGSERRVSHDAGVDVLVAE